LALALVVLVAVSTGAQTSRTRRGTAKPKPAASTPQTDAAFDAAVKLADEARNAGRLDDALTSYGKAVQIRPRWPDGWWYLGAIFYEKDLYSQARDAFRNLAALDPERGPVWGMLGLCEFQMRNYEPAVIALQRGRALGFNGNQELESVVRYHSALLHIRFEHFEVAFEILTEFLRTGGNISPKIPEAFGLAILRMPYLPAEVPGDKREEVVLAGEAGFNMAARRLDEARKAFVPLLERYPNDANVHYAFGVFQLSQDTDLALKEFQRTLELQPAHPPAMVQMAFEYLKREQFNEALPLAERAVQLVPTMYPARNVLGRILLELGQTDRAVKELEEGVRLAPLSPEMHFVLARAYTRAGRKPDADREREKFKELQEKFRQETDAAKSGIAPGAGTAKPNPE
jgi:tetratricopeptide (TPR) repeat protein